MPRHLHKIKFLTVDAHEIYVFHVAIDESFRPYTVQRSGGGGGGTSKVDLRPGVQPLTLSYTIFHRKGIPSDLLLKIGIPFIYLKRTLYPFLLLLNAPSLEMNHQKPGRFLGLFTAQCKISLLALFKVLLQTEMTDFPLV